MNDKESELSAALRLLAASTAAAQAPERVEARLRSAFRAQAARPRRRGWLLLAAASVLVAMALMTWMNRPRPAPAPLQTQIPPTPKLMVVPQPEPVAARQRPHRRSPLPSRDRKGAVRPAELATEFLPLQPDSGVMPLETVDVVRVRVPRATLIAFGLPMNEERAAEPVKADVIFGEDGIARAIRFVRDTRDFR